MANEINKQIDRMIGIKKAYKKYVKKIKSPFLRKIAAEVRSETLKDAVKIIKEQ